jgi:hypothetical protein
VKIRIDPPHPYIGHPDSLVRLRWIISLPHSR